MEVEAGDWLGRRGGRVDGSYGMRGTGIGSWIRPSRVVLWPRTVGESVGSQMGTMGYEEGEGQRLPVRKRDRDRWVALGRRVEL